MIPARINNILEQHLKTSIVSSSTVGGGCISDSSVIQTKTGAKYFLKINDRFPKDMFSKEANGLKEIAKSKTVRVPEVVLAEEDLILLEFISSKSRVKNFFTDFGIQFAKMHQYESDYFGFYEDNYIGSTLQINRASNEEMKDWVKFYFNKRLLFQFKLAEQNGYTDDNLRKAFKSLENKIDDVLKCKNVKPSLLHGDLWSGNFIEDENGKVCIIDPAVYFGHREADLAMTKLFGGFSHEFYESYNDFYPLDEGYNYRENIYKLYHVLNHLNLFGSRYYSQALSLIKYYI
jgi:fructosamine-3-kinase